MGTLGSLYSTIYNAVTGTLSPQQISDQAKQLEQAVAKAGGSPQQQTSASNEVTSFLRDFWPGRGPLQTLWDDLVGNPIGLAGQGGSGGGTPNSWSGIIAIAVVVGVIVLLVWAYGSHGSSKTTVVVRGTSARKSRSRK